MRSGYLPRAAALVCGIAFFLSRQPLGMAQEPDYKSLVSQLSGQPLSDEQVQPFVRAGAPALGAVLDDFSRSKFVQRTRKQLKKGFNLGRAMDQDVYASNVIKVAEAFGPTGVDRLVRRLPRVVVQRYGLDTPAFRKLGIGAIKPLLTMDMLQGTPKEDVPTVRDWVYTFADQRKLDEQVPTQRRTLPSIMAVVSVIVSRATLDGDMAGRYYLGRAIMFRPDIPNSYWREQLSPATRTRLLLRQLDPPKEPLSPTAPA